MKAEYTVGSYNGRVRMGKCRCCKQTKAVREEPSLGRYVHVCKPCLKELQK